MSRRLLNINDLGDSTNFSPVENIFEIIKPKPVPMSNYIPNEPIILTAEQWKMVCDKTHDATLPFTVQITVMDKQEEDQDGLEETKGDIQEPEYVPKKRRSKK